MNGTFVFPPDTLPLPLPETMSLPEQKPILTTPPRKSSLPILSDSMSLPEQGAILASTQRKTSLPTSKAHNNKSQHRVTKRTGHVGQKSDKIQGLGITGAEESNRKSRVWKACERCRMKKTKCDGQLPCKRCMDDGITCAAGHRRKIEFKQLPRGYAEVLESSQHALSATIVKLYKMVLAGETWTQGEVRLNDRNEPVVHDIATRLKTIRTLTDLELQVTNVMPQDDREMTALQDELWPMHVANGGSQQQSFPTSAGHSPSPHMPNLAGGILRGRQNSNSSLDQSPTTATFPGNNGWGRAQQRPVPQSSSEVSSPGSLSLGWDSTPTAEIDWSSITGLPGNAPMSPQHGWEPWLGAPMSRGNSFQGNNAQFPAQMANQPQPPFNPARIVPAQQNGGLKGNIAFGQTPYNPMISGNLNPDVDDGNGFNGI